ncbi:MULTISPECIES: succinylglutamate desuccinylase [unclassified Acinetobacter]|uniref:succinylglutamate desuccinylase n=1 Tax=unclassified Acinetobacter TaxID=196816 RepID=UPI0035B988F6
MDLLKHVLEQTTPSIQQGEIIAENDHVQWRYLAEGIVEFCPQSFSKSIAISAGIHGNETAPIEILSAICQDIFQGKLALKVRLLVIFGNPKSIRANKRYVDDDVNRMFMGGLQNIVPNDETARAEVLEQVTQAFFTQSPISVQRYHYDLHTAIRGSKMPAFALFPKSVYRAHDGTGIYSDFMLRTLDSAELDAIVYHATPSTTFTNFTVELCHADSVTLELGKALPFGENNLANFEPCNQMLRSIISETALPARQKPAVQHFKVTDTIVKHSDEFRLALDSETLNFTCIEANQPIATEGDKVYSLPVPTYTLFLNASVKTGLRAGMLMQKIDAVPQD